MPGCSRGRVPSLPSLTGKASLASSPSRIGGHNHALLDVPLRDSSSLAAIISEVRISEGPLAHLSLAYKLSEKPEPPQEMSLRTTLESHPLPILAAAVVASGAVVFGVTQYFHSRDMIRKPHELDDLRSRIASISRRIGDEPLFLDVLSVQIERSEVSSLPTR